MRVLLIADDDFARRERAMMTRLQVGLADEGVRVVYAVPLSVLGDVGGGLFSLQIGYESEGAPFTRRLRVLQLVHAIEDALGSGGDGGGIDVVHVFGSAWRVGDEVAEWFEAGLVLELWRPEQGPELTRFCGRRPVVRQPLVLVPDESLGRLIRARAPACDIAVAPWGTHAPTGHRPPLDPSRSVTLAMVGPGTQVEGVQAALRGIAEATAPFAETVLFVDAAMASRAGAWGFARRIGLRERMSLIPDMEGRRELTVQADILVQPEALGQHRSITLDAMAAGMLVAGAPDGLVEWLVNGETATLVPHPSAEAWRGALERLLRDREYGAGLASTARAYVRERRPAVAHVRAALAAYERARAGRPVASAGGSA